MAVEGRVFWGLSKIFQSERASIIEVYGEKKGGRFIKYSPEETKEIFPPEGKVFNPSPLESYCTFQSELNEHKRKENGEDYITIRDSLNSLNPYHILRKSSVDRSLSIENMREIEDDLKDGIYYIYIEKNKELIGPFIRDRRGLIPKTGKEAIVYDISSDSNLQELIIINHDVFFNSPEIYPKTGSIDCMSNDQLNDWFRTKLKEAKALSAEEMDALAIMIKLLKSKSLPIANDLDSDRFERVLENLDQVSFSYSELKDVLVGDGFEKISQRIDEMRLEIKKEYELQLHEELKELHEEKSTLENELDSICSKINELKLTKENIEKETDFLTKHYDSLIQQFRLDTKLKPQAIDDVKYHIKPLCYEVPIQGKPFVELKADDDLDVFYLIEKNILRAGYSDDLFRLYRSDEDSLLKSQAVFIPCISWVYIFAQSIGNAKVYTMNVEHDWLHYQDFCDNGLISIWNEAIENKNKNYILALEDLNITQPECGCAPLLDVINGYRPVLEGTNYGLPRNLKIFATLLPCSEENIGLKLSRRLFTNWKTFGDFMKPDFLQSVKTGQPDLFGYFEPDDLFTLYDNTCNLGAPYFDV